MQTEQAACVLSTVSATSDRCARLIQCVEKGSCADHSCRRCGCGGSHRGAQRVQQRLCLPQLAIRSHQLRCQPPGGGICVQAGARSVASMLVCGLASLDVER